VLGAVKIPEVMHYRLMAQAMEYITYMKNLQPIELNGIVKSRIEHLMGAKPNWATNLRKFSEVGTVKTRTKQQPKLADRGIICIFVGYPKNHPAYTYLMYNERTRMMHTIRDVIWLSRMYFDSTNHPNVDTIVPVVDTQEGTFDLIDCNEGIQDDDTFSINNVVPVALQQHQTCPPPIQIPVLVPMPQQQQPTPFPLIGDEDDENLDNEVVEDLVPAEWPQTCSSWQVRPPARFGDYIAAAHEEAPLMPTEKAYFREMPLLTKLPDDFAFSAVLDGEWTMVQQHKGRANPQPEKQYLLGWHS
jgi:hypothetical protein